MSQAKRNVLIKSIASAIPVYSMLVLQLSKNIINIIDKSLIRFWWGEQDNKKKKIILSNGGNRICDGGLGINDNKNQ